MYHKNSILFFLTYIKDIDNCSKNKMKTFLQRIWGIRTKTLIFFYNTRKTLFCGFLRILALFSHTFAVFFITLTNYKEKQKLIIRSTKNKKACNWS